MLYNGCAILVTTAPCFKRLYNTTPDAFSKRRLDAIVIDDIDEISVHFASEIKFLLRTLANDQIQLIVTSTVWQNAYLRFFDKHPDMLLCIGSSIEAAIYGNASFELACTKHDRKLTFVCELINQTPECERTIVVCNDEGHIGEVLDAFKIYGILYRTTFKNGELDTFRMTCWDNLRESKYPVIVTCDAHLSELQITNAQHLIHYALPDTWGKFVKRFECMLSYYPDVVKGVDIEKGQVKLSSNLY
jgi:superfamily II DNA/RNA helicase